MLEFGEGLFDGIEVGTVGRQEEEIGAYVADGFAGGLAFVAAEIVHDDDVAQSERWDQELLDVGEVLLAVDWTVEEAGGVDPIDAQRGEEDERAPAAVRRLADQLLAAAPSPGAGPCWSWARFRR